MGLTSSGDFTCGETDKALEGIEGVQKSVDDALCEDRGGGPIALTEKMEEVLQSLRNYGIIASSKKLEMGSKVAFSDCVIEGKVDGISITPDPERIRAVVGAREPRCRKEVECYLGQIRALAKWFPKLNISTPNISNNLTKGKHFVWDQLMKEEFEAVKEQLKSPNVLSPFDMRKKTFLYTDAARLEGLGFILIQENEEGE